MMLGRAHTPDPGVDAAYARLVARVDQAVAEAATALRAHAGNRPLCDLALDIINTLTTSPQPDIPVIPGR